MGLQIVGMTQTEAVFTFSLRAWSRRKSSFVVSISSRPRASVR